MGNQFAILESIQEEGTKLETEVHLIQSHSESEKEIKVVEKKTQAAANL